MTSSANQELDSRDVFVPVLCNRELSNDEGDGNGNGNENVKTAIGLLSKTTSLHVHHAFLDISLPLLHDYDVKIPNFTFYGGRKQATMKFSFSI